MPAARLFLESPDPPSLQTKVAGLFVASVALPLLTPHDAGETPEIEIVKIVEGVIVTEVVAVQPLAVVAVMS
jgi:hypothetical protein